MCFIVSYEELRVSLLDISILFCCWGIMKYKYKHLKILTLVTSKTWKIWDKVQSKNNVICCFFMSGSEKKWGLTWNLEGGLIRSSLLWKSIFQLVQRAKPEGCSFPSPSYFLSYSLPEAFILKFSARILLEGHVGSLNTKIHCEELKLSTLVSKDISNPLSFDEAIP